MPHPRTHKPVPESYQQGAFAGLRRVLACSLFGATAVLALQCSDSDPKTGDDPFLDGSVSTVDADLGPDAGPAEEVFALDSIAGNDANTCFVDSPCQTLARGIMLAESRRDAELPTRILLAPGNYGELDWNLGGDFTQSVSWSSQNPDEPAQISRLRLSCDEECIGRQTFESIDFHRTAGIAALRIVEISVNEVTIRDSEIHNEQLYDGSGVIIVGKGVTLEGNRIHSIIHAIRYKGSNHVFRNNEIRRFPGSALSMLCGGALPERPQSAWDILIEGNRIHQHIPDFPEEPGYENYDEPAELHASILSIRGSDITFRGNWLWDISDEAVRIQFYVGDCGISNYEIQNVTIENNVVYGIGGGILQATASPLGPVLVRHNTIIGGWLLFVLKSPIYSGAGTEVRDNLIVGGYGGVVNAPYENYDATTAEWISENNVANSLGYPSGTQHPSNLFIDDEISAGNLGADVRESGFFVKPNYVEDTPLLCAPMGTDDCDWTPKPGSVLCTAGTNGGHVGAIPCTP